MQYTYNGRTHNIPDSEIRHNMTTYRITKEEAITMWLEDEGYYTSPELQALLDKGKESRITATIHQAKATDTKERKPRPPRKADEAKEGLITAIAQLLSTLGADTVEITNKSKEITFVLGESHYKLNLSRTNLALAEKKAHKNS